MASGSREKEVTRQNSKASTSDKAESVRDFNLKILDKAQVGDLLEFPRGLYSHWAVYIGKGKVIHIAGENDDGLSGDVRVRLADCMKVANNSKMKINNCLDPELRPLPATEILENAEGKLGAKGYDLVFSNCEHFATWCRYGKARSIQVDNATQKVTEMGLAIQQRLTQASESSEDEKTRKLAKGLLDLGNVVSKKWTDYNQARFDEQLKHLRREDEDSQG